MKALERIIKGVRSMPPRNKVLIIGALCFAGLTTILGTAEIKSDNKRLDDIYLKAGGGDMSLHKFEKANFAMTSTNYTATSKDARFLENIRAMNLPDRPLYKDWKYLFSDTN